MVKTVKRTKSFISHKISGVASKSNSKTKRIDKSLTHYRLQADSGIITIDGGKARVKMKLDNLSGIEHPIEKSSQKHTAHMREMKEKNHTLVRHEKINKAVFQAAANLNRAVAQGASFAGLIQPDVEKILGEKISINAIKSSTKRIQETKKSGS